MTDTLSPEMFWLVLTVLMTALIWVPYILNRMAEKGIWATLQNPSPDDRPQAAWAIRAAAAHRNAVENLVIFAPLILAVEATGMNSGLTAGAAAIYFLARAAHLIIYIIGIPVLRTLAFAIGFFAQLALAFVLLGWV